jgi:hypothetical protein
MQDQFLFDVAEDVILRDLSSLPPEPDYRSYVSNDQVQKLQETIQKQNLDLDSMAKKIQEHEHLLLLLRVRSVQCLSAFSKYNTAHMHKESKSILKLDDLLAEVNRSLPIHMKPMDRSELLDTIRQLNESQNLGMVWRKSNSNFVCDGWSIRKQNNPQVPILPQIQMNSVVNSPRSPIMSGATSPAPVSVMKNF